MKRVRVWDKLISYDNISKAIDNVNKSHRWCAPGKPNKRVIWVTINKENCIKELQAILENGFEQSPTTPKRRYDRNAKKWRDIEEPKLYPDQYIHHALVQVLEPVMMRGMDRWTCGSIKGRGAIDGMRAIKRWMKGNYKNVRWCIEADIYHFYDSIKPERVIERMRRLLKDYKTLDLIERIIKDGIKIGFYTSQWLANTLLQPLDRAIRDKGIRKSIRYLDNFTIFSNSKRNCRDVLKMISDWLISKDLKLKGNYQIFKVPYRIEKVILKNGLSRINKRIPNALGYRYGRGFTLLRKHALLTIKRQVKSAIKKINKKSYISVSFAYSLLSRLGRLRHCNSSGIYNRYIPNGIQKILKSVIRRYQRKGLKEWNSILEQEKTALCL